MKAKQNTIKLRGLPGISVDEIDAVYINNPSEINKALGKGLAVTAANYNGAFNIWKDDNGIIRCESIRYCQRLEYKEYSDIKQVEKWAKKWLAKIK